MANLLVTGGAGFIGANFVRYWRRQYPSDSIVVLDALTYAGYRGNLDGLDDVLFVHDTICNLDCVEKILIDRKIDTIVHFAAESHVDRSIHGPDAFVDTNVRGTHCLLKAAKRVWLDRGTGAPHRFHHVSTDEVYGSLDPDDPAFTEQTQYAPNSPYSATKAASDLLVRAYHQTYQLQTTTSNCSNNYGPYQFPEKLIPLFMTNALRGKPLPIYGDGRNVRDWLHVEDHCFGIDLILKHGRIGEVYNIGGGMEIPNLTVIEEICRSVDKLFQDDPGLKEFYPDAPAARGAPTASLKSFVKDRPGHDRRYAIDETKIREQLGYAPRRSFKDGLSDTLRWYIDNEAWWRKILLGTHLVHTYDHDKLRAANS